MAKHRLRMLALVAGLFIAACSASAPTQQAAPNLPPNLRQDLYPKWIDAQAQVRWPPNNGCAAAPASQTLAAGTRIDRFGSEGGTFFSPEGESFAARALPYVCSKMGYTVYRVDKPLHVATCKAAPWFDQPGGATQYQTDAPAYKLRESGAIEVASGDSAGNGKSVSPCGSP